MLNKLKELRDSREEGFTLIELLVVIVIIGVLAAIALPIFLNQQKAAIDAGTKSDVRNAVTAVATALVKTPTLTDTAAGVGDLSTAVANSPKTDGTTLSTGKSITTAGVVSGVAAWNGYVIKGVNSGNTGFWYAFDSASGKYTQSA